MGYRVRTTVGEMTYGNIEQLRQALEFGLVGPDALVFEPDQPWGRPASKILGEPSRAPAQRVARPAVRPRRGFEGVSYIVMALAVLGLLYLELPRLTVMFPGLWNIPGLPWFIRRPNPGGAVILPSWVTGFVAPPRDLGWVDVGLGALLLLAFLFVLLSATPQSAAFLALVGGYFLATGRIPHAVPLCVGAALLYVRWLRGPRTRPEGRLQVKKAR